MVRVKSKPFRSLPDIDYTLPEVAVWFFGQPPTKKKSPPVAPTKSGRKLEKEKARLKRFAENGGEPPERPHPLASHPDVPPLTNMQELITAAIYNGRDESGWCTFEKMFDYVSKQWRSMRRRDGSNFAADCRRAIQSGLRQTPNQLSLFRKDPNNRERWQFIEQYDDAVEEARRRLVERRARKSGRLAQEAEAEAESEASDAEDDAADGEEGGDDGGDEGEDGAGPPAGKGDGEDDDVDMADAKAGGSSQEAGDVKQEDEAEKPAVEPDEASMDVDEEEAAPRSRGRKKKSWGRGRKSAGRTAAPALKVETERAESQEDTAAPSSPVQTSPTPEALTPLTPRLAGSDFQIRLSNEVANCIVTNMNSCPLDIIVHTVTKHMPRQKDDPPPDQLRRAIVGVLNNSNLFQREHDKKKAGWWTLSENSPYGTGLPRPTPPLTATPTPKRPEQASTPTEPPLSPASRKRGRGRPSKSAREDPDEDEEAEETQPKEKQPKLEKARKDDSEDEEKAAAAAAEEEDEESEQSVQTDGEDEGANGKAESRGDHKEPTELMGYIINAIESAGQSGSFEQIFQNLQEAKTFDKLRRRDGKQYTTDRDRRNIIQSRLTSSSQASRPWVKQETNKKGVKMFRLTQNSLEWLKEKQATERDEHSTTAHSDSDAASDAPDADEDETKAEEREEEIDDEDSLDDDKEEREEPRGKQLPANRLKRAKQIQEQASKRQLRATNGEAAPAPAAPLAPKRAAAVTANAINAAQGTINRKAKRKS